MNNYISDNLKSVQKRIALACKRVGREPSEVTLLPVSKTKTAGDIRLAHKAGIRRFGENKVKEAQSKMQSTSDLNLNWCIIGHLQTNKSKYVAEFAAEVHSLDSIKLARKLDRRLQKLGRSIDVLIQVNTSAEPQKYGIEPEEAFDFSRELISFETLQVKGLMTLALFSQDKPKVRECFVRLRNLRDRLRQEAPHGMSWDVLSMGMSGDFEIAIEEGATEVRIGQAIFGARHLPDSHFWPSAKS